MRGMRSTIVLLVVLVGLGAYIYFVTWKLPTDEKKEVKVFGTLLPDKIEALQIKSEKGETTTLAKKDGAWQITAPEAAPTDETEANAVAGALSSVVLGRTIEENPAKLEDYGLAPPRIDVAFKTAGDTDYRHLLIGEKTATGGDLFAKLGTEKKVFLIPAFQEQTFNKGLFELRDKTLLAFNHDKLDGIEVTAPGKTLVLAKSGADWNITKPIQVRADPSTVEGLRARLETAQMKSIVATAPTPADLKTYGLDKPERTVTLNFGEHATLQFGSKAEDGSIYTRAGSKPTVVTVDAALADDLTKGADEYRRKDIFDFTPISLTRIEFIRPNGSALPFEKVKGETKDGKEAEDAWRRLGPNPVDAPKATMDRLLLRVSTMRAASFVESTAKTGLDRPELTIVVKYGEGKEERVSFGRVENDVFASRQGEPGAARVDATEYSESYKALLDLSK